MIPAFRPRLANRKIVKVSFFERVENSSVEFLTNSMSTRRLVAII